MEKERTSWLDILCVVQSEQTGLEKKPSVRSTTMQESDIFDCDVPQADTLLCACTSRPSILAMPIKKLNNDYCSGCRGIGRFLCCDGCPRSFHFMCLEPPLRLDEMPAEDTWYCKECRAARIVSLGDPCFVQMWELEIDLDDITIAEGIQARSRERLLRSTSGFDRQGESYSVSPA